MYPAFKLLLAVLAISCFCASHLSAQQSDIIYEKKSVNEVVRTSPLDGTADSTFEDLDSDIAFTEETVDRNMRLFIGRSRSFTRNVFETSDNEPELKLIGSTPPRRVGNKWVATYRLEAASIPLSGQSQISAIFVEQTSRKKIRERNLPKAYSFKLVDGTVPAPTVDIALAFPAGVAKIIEQQKAAGNTLDPNALEMRASRLEIWVHPESEEGHLAWAIDVALPGPLTRAGNTFRVWVPALRTDGKDLVGFDSEPLDFNEHHGTVRAIVFDPTPIAEPLKVHPLGSAQIVRVPLDTSESSENVSKDIVESQSNGTFRFTKPSGRAKLFVRLKNRHFSIEDHSGSTIVLEAEAGSESPIELHFNSESEQEVAQPSAFYWANSARSFLKAILKQNQLEDVRVTTNFDESCNAYFKSSTRQIVLYRASKKADKQKCINKAYLDTIFHEYGHAVDFAFGGIASGNGGASYSEGFGDALAILFKGNSCYGADHRGAGTCLRDAASPIVKYPATSIGHHQRGKIYSGFTWELLNTLKGTNAATARNIALSLTLQAAALNPSNIPNAIELMLDADDDDLDLSNGTPHSKSIVRAAKSRNIPLPADLPQH